MMHLHDDQQWMLASPKTDNTNEHLNCTRLIMITRRQLCQQGIWLGIGFSWHAHANLVQAVTQPRPALPLAVNTRHIIPMTQYRLATFQASLGQYFFVADASGEYSNTIQLVAVKEFANQGSEQFLLRFHHSAQLPWPEQIYDIALTPCSSELLTFQLFLNPVHGLAHYLDATINQAV